MSFLSLKYLVLAAVIFAEPHDLGIGHFPLKDCHTGQFDILLMVKLNPLHDPFMLRFMVADFHKQLIDIWTHNDLENSRVLFRTVCDHSVGGTCDLRLEETDICNRSDVLSSVNFDSKNVHMEIKMNIKIASTIFSDLGVGRQNSSHIAIIVVNRVNFPNLTVDGIMSINDAVQEERSEVKVFVLVYDLTSEIGPFLLGDTLFVGKYISWEGNIASIALCNRCLPGWFPLEYKRTNNAMSCYKLEIGPYAGNWLTAAERCKTYDATLVTVESKEELDFLGPELFLRLIENKEHIYNPTDSLGNSSMVYIGLRRDSMSVAKRFQWELNNPTRYHPLVLNHWLEGKPSGGFSHACGVWLYNGIFEDKVSASPGLTNINNGKSTFADYKSTSKEGWSDVGCGTELTKLSLCEIWLPLNVKDEGGMKIDPANKESFNKAASRDEYREFEGSIKSITAYVNDIEVRRFLKDNNEEFPLFDCGDDTGPERYIPYSHVCDSVDHCSNRRDEIVCGSISCNTCRSGQCIHDLVKCDMVKDCDDGSDEENCNDCRGRRCCDGTCLPAHLFNDRQVDCTECTAYDSEVNDESGIINAIYKNETCAFICNTNKCIFESQFNDGILHCTGPEGHLDETIGKLPRASSCYNTQGYHMWAPRCVYFKDRYGAILGCRDLSHLQDCESFPCQEGYYKCPDTYCIPVHYVLDGKSDCPAGEEERDTENYSCMGHFDCWKSKVCLHPDLVCDRHADCPHKDDELNCNVQCPNKGIRCVAGTLTLKNKTSSINTTRGQLFDSRHRYLDVSGVDLSYMSFFPKFVFLFEIKLSNCRVKCTINECPIILHSKKGAYSIDLSYNLIRSIDNNNFPIKMYEDNLRSLNLSFNEHFDGLVNIASKLLETLDLSHTGLSYFEENYFKNMPSLEHLNLSYTKMNVFHVNIFPSSVILESLDLRGIPIEQFFENTFNGLIIRSALYATNFQMCCPQVRGDHIPTYLCHASEDSNLSCFDLIEIEAQRFLLWIVGAVAILGNLTVIVYRLIWDRSTLEMAYGLFVLNLGISDLLMGLYLLMIAGADVYYRGVYVLYDKVWKASNVCKTAGFLATLSSETSTFFVLLITVDRFLVLKFPYGQKKFSRISTIIVVVLAWGVGFMLALIPVLPIFENESIFSSRAICIGLPLTSERLSGWGYSFSVFIVLNFVLFLIIAFGQVAIFKSMSDNRVVKEASSQNSFRRAQNIVVAKQLSLVVLSDFFCWFPVGLVGLLVLSGHEISKDVYAWIAVIVLPVNSALNPPLYTIPLVLAVWDKFKYRDSKPR